MSRIIDLRGPDGNVFCIAGLAQSWNRQIDTAETNARGSIMEETTEYLDGKVGDYTDVLDTFDRWFKGLIRYKFVGDPRVDGYVTEHEDY